MKQNKLVANPAGGFDLLTERDGGNPIRILTGAPIHSAKYFRSLKRLSEKALLHIKEMDVKDEIPDDVPAWEVINNKLIEDNRILLSALRRMKKIETMADGELGKGMVDAPHTKGMRAMVLVAEEAINKITNELYA